nr:lycopene cyclase family protein [Allomuricauda sp.]
MSNYDYIIIGAGAAGLQLAAALGNDPYFSNRSILVIDKDDKTKNDRTWCFWEEGTGGFEPILSHQWSRIKFAGKELDLSTKLHPYNYKMVKGLDLYNYYVPKVKAYPNINWVQEEVLKLVETEAHVEVITQNSKYRGKQVFNSKFDRSKMMGQTKYPVLQQHFLGWFVKTGKPVFNPDEATFMDFSIPQNGNTRFMYVLPFSENEALLEYTLFSEKLLEKSEYEQGIREYIAEKLGGTPYEILETEQGCIPMTCYPFHKENSDRIFHMGIAGGWAKPSTGFTFYNTYKEIKRVVATLKDSKSLKSLNKRDKFWFYDLLLLDILYKDNHLGGAIFESMFKRRKVELILKFLGNGTSFREDLKIISACPKRPFLKALWNRIF